MRLIDIIAVSIVGNTAVIIANIYFLIYLLTLVKILQHHPHFQIN